MNAFGVFADQWAPLALAATWQLAALVVVALICERLFRLRQPRARHALWWFVLVAPLMLAPGRTALARRDTMATVPLPAPAARLVAAAPRPSAAPARPAPLRITEAPPVADTSPRPSWWSQVRVTDLFALAWLMGCGVLALRLVVGHRRVRRMLAESRPVQEAVALEALAQLCEEAGVRRGIELRSSHGVGAPVLYGLRRPTVLVPEDWLHSLSAGDVRALLAHEVAHVRRLDFLANLVQRLVEIPLFFHPGVWLASRRIVLAREELCDAWALGRGVEAGSYARSLAAAAERAHGRLAAPSVGVVESRFTLLRRVEAIMQTSSVRRLRRPLAIALAAIVLGAAAAFAAVQIGGGLPAAANQGAVGEGAQVAALQAQDIEQEMKHLALAMLMYLQDAEGTFPPTDDVKEIQALLGPYMGRQDIFRRDLRYVMPPGVSVGSIEMPHFTPLAIVDHEAALQVVAYVDGHTEVKRRQEEGSASERIIELTIVHENGAPARGAKIRMLGDGRKAALVADDRGHRKGVITNAGGEASFYIQSADGREDSLATVLFTAAGGGREAKRVILYPWGTAAGTVSFSGRVVDEQGRMVEGASVWAYGFERMGLPGQRGVGPVFLSRELGQTGADGGFSAKIPRLPSGSRGWGGGWIEPWTCQLIAHRSGHGVGWTEADGDSVIAGVEIRLSEPGGLRGTVLDADGQLLPKVSVRLSELRVPETAGNPAKTLVFDSGASVPLWAERRTDERAEFAFADLPAEAAVTLSGSTCGAGESCRLDQQFPDLGEIKLAEQRGDIVIKLVGTPIIEGVLLTPDPEREPASNVEVQLAGPCRDDPHSIFSGRAVTDDEGRYEFRLPEAGSYTLWVADAQHFAVVARDLQIEPGRRITLPAVVLQRTGSIRGRALDAVTGESIPGVHVICDPRTERLPFPVVTTESGATAGPDGSFLVGAPPGEVLLHASGPPSGYTWNHSVTKETVDGKTLVRVTEDERKPTHRLLQVESGGTLTGVDLFFTPEARLQGIVLGPDGQPWRRAGHVHGHLDPEFVRSHSHPPIGDRVGKDGRFSSRYLYPEVPVVFLMVDPERGLGGGVRVTPTRAKATEITIHLKPMVRVVGRVLRPDGTPAAGVDIRPTRSPSVTTTSGEGGRFEVIGGIVGLPCTVRAYVLRPREQRQLLGWYEFIGASQAHEVSSGQRVLDIGDIVLEPYELPKGE